jgi:uncharacterized membrane protein YwzB
MLPSYSSIVAYMSQSKLEIKDGKVTQSKRFFMLRALISTMLVASIGTLVALSIYICEHCATANQHSLASAICAGLFLGTTLTNMVRAFLYASCQISYVTPQYVLQLCKDIDAVNSI